MTRSLIRSLRASIGARRGCPALLAPRRGALCHDALPDVVERLAAQLPVGDLIATLLPAGPDAVLVSLAAMQSGAVLPLSPEATAHDIALALDRMRPSLVLKAEGMGVDVVALAGARGIPVALVKTGAAIGDIGLTGAPATARSGLALPDGTRLLLQTSGTTAAPKAVPLTETNLSAAAEALAASLRLMSEDRALNLLPQFHIGGLWDLVAAPLLSGGSVICGGAFSRRAFAEGMDLAPTWVQLAPPMLADLVADTEQGRLGLRFIRSVSTALPARLRREAEIRLGVPVVEIYGMTETAGVITSQPLDRQDGSVGHPVGLEVTLRDGEVVVRGPQLSPGYLLAGPEDQARFTPEGFRTGDLGRLDASGQLWITGRAKDLINRGGEMVAPAEVEEALRSLPWVVDAGVFPVAHPTLGEEIAAAIVLSGGPADPAGEARRAVRHLLGHGRMPAVVHVIDALPRTASGKLQRGRLSELCTVAQPPPTMGAETVELSPIGEWVAVIWAGALGVAALGPGEDFFLAGGTSLQAAQAIALMQDQFPDALLYVSSVYDAPTPAAFEVHLRTHYPEICASILHARVMAPTPVPPVTEADRAAFAEMLRCPAPPVRTGAPNPRAVFLLSAPRSGSTLLRVMLAGHPALFAPPELYLLSHRDLAARRDWFGRAHASQLEGLPRAVMAATVQDAAAATAAVRAAEAAAHPVAEVYRELQAHVSPRLLVDKTPFYAVHPETLAAAETLFTDAVYIHLTRHPYGMIRSFETARLDQLWWPRLTGPDGPPAPFQTRQLAELIWARITETTTTFLRGIPMERQVHLRYEDLVAQPGEAMDRLCATLGLTPDPAMLTPTGPAAERMTDGLHAASRMIGDPAFHRHSGLSSDGAEAWRRHYSADFLSEPTWQLARMLGHSETVGTGADLISFEL